MGFFRHSNIAPPSSRRFDPTRRAVNLKRIWPRREPKARAVHAAGGLGASPRKFPASGDENQKPMTCEKHNLLFCLDLSFWGWKCSRGSSAASMQFTAMHATAHPR